MRKSKHYCSSCKYWKPGDTWRTTQHPHFAVVTKGICTGTVKEKLNCNRACVHYERNTNIKGQFIEYTI